VFFAKKIKSKMDELLQELNVDTTKIPKDVSGTMVSPIDVIAVLLELTPLYVKRKFEACLVGLAKTKFIGVRNSKEAGDAATIKRVLCACHDPRIIAICQKTWPAATTPSAPMENICLNYEIPNLQITDVDFKNIRKTNDGRFSIIDSLSIFIGTSRADATIHWKRLCECPLRLKFINHVYCHTLFDGDDNPSPVCSLDVLLYLHSQLTVRTVVRLFLGDLSDLRDCCYDSEQNLRTVLASRKQTLSQSFNDFIVLGVRRFGFHAQDADTQAERIANAERVNAEDALVATETSRKHDEWMANLRKKYADKNADDEAAHQERMANIRKKYAEEDAAREKKNADDEAAHQERMANIRKKYAEENAAREKKKADDEAAREKKKADDEAAHKEKMAAILEAHREWMAADSFAETPRTNNDATSGTSYKKVRIDRQKKRPRAAIEKQRVGGYVFKSSTVPPAKQRNVKPKVVACVFQSSSLPQKIPRS
jgi:hypothetical protein